MQFVMTSEFCMCPLIMLPLTVSVVDGASCIRCAVMSVAGSHGAPSCLLQHNKYWADMKGA